jgi:hypothetical protein
MAGGTVGSGTVNLKGPDGPNGQIGLCYGLSDVSCRMSVFLSDCMHEDAHHPTTHSVKVNTSVDARGGATPDETSTTTLSQRTFLVLPNAAHLAIQHPHTHTQYPHRSLPAAAPDLLGLFLPITPLPRTEANIAYVAEQREAWERGLPPPHVRLDGLVALENPGSVEQIGSSGGKRAMGY